MSPRPELTFDEYLREVPTEVAVLSAHIEKLEQSLALISDPQKIVSTLGELGTLLRIQGDFEKAEDKIRSALKIIAENKLGLRFEIQQKIRLGHILQWKKQFAQSNDLFSEIISSCRTCIEAQIYLDFALQHAGKNLFDQMRFKEALQAFEEALQLRLERQAPPDQITSTQIAIQRTKELLS